MSLSSNLSAKPVHIVVNDVDIDRGGRAVIRGLDMVVAGGEALVLSGPNGVGKTTLLRAVAGFVPLVKGTIELAGGDRELTVGEQSHFIGHQNAVKPNLTVAENIDIWARFLGGAPLGALLDGVLRRFALEPLADVPASYLSAGQRRRLGLARLLTARRPIWLLDEPTVSLDSASVELVSAAIRDHVASGGLVLAATHLDLKLPSARQFKLG